MPGHDHEKGYVGPFVGGGGGGSGPPDPPPDSGPTDPPDSVTSSLPAGLHVGPLLVGPGTVQAPEGYDGPARLVQFVTGITTAPLGDADLVGWAFGATTLDSRMDAGASGSRTACSSGKRVMGDVTGQSGHLTDATASAYVALQVGATTGTEALAASVNNPQWTITGHDHFNVSPHAHAAVHVQLVTSLGQTAPTITDSGGFTWTLLHQEALGSDGYASIWSAPIPAGAEADVPIHLSVPCDSGIGFSLSVEPS